MSTEEERARDLANRERFRRDKPSRFSDGNKDRDRSTDRSERTRRPSKHRVYVANICYDYRWHDLKDLFRTHVGDVQYVEMFVDENDKFKGCAIIEFSDAASVKKCIEVMHRFNLKGRKLVVKEDLGDERDKYGNFVNERKNRELDHKDDNRRDRNWDAPQSLMGSLFDRQHSENTENKIGQTWGLSTQFLESLGINRPLVSRVFVANLDYKVDEKKIKEVFKLAGKIMDIELSHDKEGNSRGFAIIDYDHPVEAVQAISMFHHQILYDRKMTVRMDREDSPLKLPDGLKGVGMGLGVNGEPLRDVSRHLPSQTNQSSDLSTPNSGPGILGAVPNPIQNLGTAAAALSNVVANPLANLANASAALGLTGNQFLANNLNELGLAANLNPSIVSNSLNSNTLQALGGNLSQLNNLNSLSSLGGNLSTQNLRSDSNVFASRDRDVGNRDFSSGNREYETTSLRSYDKNESDYRDEFRQQNSNPLYSTVNNGSQRGQITGQMKQENKFSDTVVVNNLPPTASWKLLREKFGGCGDIQFVEMKSKETAVVRFTNDWAAERAIRELDRSRIDGRTIEVRYF